MTSFARDLSALYELICTKYSEIKEYYSNIEELDKLYDYFDNSNPFDEYLGMGDSDYIIFRSEERPGYIEGAKKRDDFIYKISNGKYIVNVGWDIDFFEFLCASMIYRTELPPSCPCTDEINNVKNMCERLLFDKHDYSGENHDCLERFCDEKIKEGTLPASIIFDLLDRSNPWIVFDDDTDEDLQSFIRDYE